VEFSVENSVMDLPEQASDLVDSLPVPQPYKVRKNVTQHAGKLSL
jgi:hypothetical protein